MRYSEPAKLIDRLRLLMLLDACEAANLAPVPVMRLHALAFLANVLAPIWSLKSHDGKVLKRRGGPYYPELQHELDILVGIGMATVHDVAHVFEDQVWRIEGAFSLNSERADSFLSLTSAFSDERKNQAFFRKLAFALARSETPIEQLVSFDATWADKRTGTGDVIDFSEWKLANYSTYAADYFSRVATPNITLQQGEKLQLYVRLLERRAHG